MDSLTSKDLGLTTLMDLETLQVKKPHRFWHCMYRHCRIMVVLKVGGGSPLQGEGGYNKVKYLTTLDRASPWFSLDNTKPGIHKHI